MLKGHPSRRLVWGYARRETQQIVDALLAQIDPILLGRKGRLLPLSSADIDRSLLETLYRRYYADSSFDIVPSLREALTALHAQDEALRASIPLVLVLQDWEVLAVGTDEAAIWALHLDETSEVLAPRPRTPAQSLVPSFQQPQRDAPSLRATQRRLATGDVLVATTRPSERLKTGSLKRVVKGNRTAADAARAISRAARGRGEAPRPAIVLSVAGLSPVPEFVSASRPPVAERRPRESSLERSPIWTAVVVCILAVALALWITKPKVSNEDLDTVLAWLLTPVPTSATQSVTSTEVSSGAGESLPTHTPTRIPIVTVPTRVPPTPTATTASAVPNQRARPSPTPTASPTPYAPPEPLSPGPRENVHNRELLLSWDWEGALRGDEYFDVRLWRLGTPKHSIAWTQERHYTERNPESGWYSWTVVVIRGKDGVVDQDLTDEPEPVEFQWHADDEEPPEEITVVPTRITHVDGPTRVVP